jgi:hypothetical protein
VANTKEYYKLVVEVEDERGECFAAVSGRCTLASASVLLRIATQLCMETGLSFDEVVQGLEEEIKRSGHPFESSDIFRGSRTN